MTGRLADVLRGEGLTDRPGLYGIQGIHSWRCELPEKCGRCDCFQELVKAVLDLLDSDTLREVVGRAIWAENLHTARTANMPDGEARGHFADVALAAVRDELGGAL